MHPKNLKIENFTYDLPEQNIAYHSVEPRDRSKLLIYKKGEISQDFYFNIAQQLPEDAVLVFNDTKVIKSRLFFQRPTGATIEVFCLEPYENEVEYDKIFEKKGNTKWICLIGKVGKWKEKQLHKKLNIKGQEVQLSVEIVEKKADSFVVQFSWTPAEIPFGTIIEAAGNLPLPPYIKRNADSHDDETYQTIYSENKGSVAAPTAGLHFTPTILEELEAKKIPKLFTTLHVGAGTFMPVKSDTMENHNMHAEVMSISIDFLEQLLPLLSKKIIAVGTTSTRTLESLYWMGNKIVNQPNISFDDLKIKQWHPYSDIEKHPVEVAISALKLWITQHGLSQLNIETQIIIAPSYQFKVVKGLITNFHQPQSTLLLLVAALIGESWKNLYQYAIDNNFRFLSYGDGNLLLP